MLIARLIAHITIGDSIHINSIHIIIEPLLTSVFHYYIHGAASRSGFISHTQRTGQSSGLRAGGVRDRSELRIARWGRKGQVRALGCTLGA